MNRESAAIALATELSRHQSAFRALLAKLPSSLA